MTSSWESRAVGSAAVAGSRGAAEPGSLAATGGALLLDVVCDASTGSPAVIAEFDDGALCGDAGPATVAEPWALRVTVVAPLPSGTWPLVAGLERFGFEV